ncbi:DMT family transporter [Jannaschia rubra]|uniref:EamA-like transporter family protein n=1 Tax=Jannaschia rubra TaxID=282197 RepID=A0A0M6XN37_9RHOB|nr:DMT family transporter [Jannaschia rubra]CTQ32082.1 EamA-like transporter family protein [Jannaschia rubra]SFG37986.1 EamA-like transporter family protein [Jannaschia rubra]
MSLWVFASLFAASVQALRFLLQKKLAVSGLSPAAATFARFVYAPAIIAAGLAGWTLATAGVLPRIAPGFWTYALSGGIAQILATMCVVALFARRNFAVGIAFSKVTVLMTVVAGFLVLGESVTLADLSAMGVGLVGVLILSVPADGGWQVFNRASALGLASGAFFSISAVGYRGASLLVMSEAPLLRAAVTLCLVTLLQTLLLGAWLGWRDRAGLLAVFQRWRATALVGATSMAGSMGWFTAYTLQTAAYVNAVGQVELILSILISWLVLGERFSRRELLAIALVTASVIALILLQA